MLDEDIAGIDTEEPVEETREKQVEDVAIKLHEIEAEATKKERQRVAEIREASEKFKRSKKVVALSHMAIEKGMSIETFRAQLLDVIQEGGTRESVATNLGMTDKEVQRYSLLRLCRAQVESKARGVSPEKIAPYEYAIHCELMDALPAKRADHVRGMLVPYDVQSRGMWVPPSRFRAPPADTVENASLVSEDHLADRFIEAIRSTSAVMAAGATSLTGLVGDLTIPREEALPFEWLTEDQNATDQDYVTDAVTLSPTTTAGHVSITRRLLKQSSPDVDQIVRQNLVLGAAQEIDLQALQGTGVGALPTGIRNQADVLTVGTTQGAITWAQAVEFETTVEASSNLIAGGSYIVHPTMKGLMKTTSKDPGSGMFIWDGQVNGYPAFSSTHAGTADGIVFGNYSNCLIGFWGVLDILMDEFTKAASGGLVIRAFQDVDVAVRRGNAFAIENATP